MDFDRTFFMDGLEMDVNAMTRDTPNENEESDEEALEPSNYDYEANAKRMEVARRELKQRQDEEMLSGMYNNTSMGYEGGGSDIMKQLWDEEMRRAQASSGMGSELPWDEENDDGEGDEPKLPNFEGEVDAEALIPENGTVPKMDQGFYHGVEAFLSSGPPSHLNNTGGSKKKGDVEVARALNKVGNGGKKGSGTRARGLPEAKKANIVTTRTGKATTGGVGRKKQQQGQQARSGTGPIDRELLNEAFEHANRAMKEAKFEEEEEQQEAERKARQAAFEREEKKMQQRQSARPSDNQYVDMGSATSASKGLRPARSAPPTGSKGGKNAAALGNGGRAGSSDSGSSMVKKLRGQAQAYAGADHGASGSGVGSATGRGTVRAKKAGTGAKNNAGGGGSGASVFDSRAQAGGFNTSFGTSEGYGNAGGNYNKNSYKGNISGSGLREGAKKATLDIRSMVNNFESGEGLAKLKAELEKSRQSMERSQSFTRQAMEELNFGM